MAAYISKINDCPFCIGAHTATATQASQNEVMVTAALADLESAPVGERLRATLRMLGRLARDRHLSAEDVRAVLDTGVSRQQVEDALAICYAFNVTNRLANAFGFEVMTPAGFQAGGQVPAPARLPLTVTGAIMLPYGHSRWWWWCGDAE
jgi:AhpD family alkylhydroperoxidase